MTFYQVNRVDCSMLSLPQYEKYLWFVITSLASPAGSVFYLKTDDPMVS